MQERSNTYHHAKRELDILISSSTDPEDRPIVEEFYDQILELCDKFGNSSQSGGSYAFVATVLSQAIKTLCCHEALCPLTGLDEEWWEVTEMNDGKPMWQNTRESAVFKDNAGAYYLDAIVWKGDITGTFTGEVQGILSRQYIKSFPFTPKTFYIDVIDTEEKPDHWNHQIRDPKQLERVWRYYENRFSTSDGV